MKHNLKRILPILLAIIVILSIIWYLFIYDRNFTRDILIDGARHFESRGNHTFASWLYDVAYDYSGGNDDVAIEMAEQFLAVGDYTKAEQTLRRAIKDGGSAQLYIALSKTYVMQDKPKDAISMLDNVTNEKIRQQLDAMRPAVPVASAESGYYRQYITVTLEHADGTLYMTSDGTYPSTKTQTENTVTLAGGENKIQAFVLSESGLVSPLAYYEYVVHGVVEEVTLNDPAVNKLVRKKLEVGEKTTLKTDDLWTITDLVFPKKAKASEDLSFLTGLKTLTVENSAINDWSSIASLSELTELTMKGCLISAQDLLAIGSLPKLEKLVLSNCSISSIQNLSSAKRIKQLDLSNNTIRDISPLSSMTSLEKLDLNHNALKELNALNSLVNLQTLDLSFNSLASIAPLSGCTKLTQLNISNNTIDALTGTEGMKNLTKLDASYNALKDISLISNCSVLSELDVSNNKLTDIKALSALKGLQYLNFSRNQVKELPNWGKTCALVTIDGSYNALTSLSTLAGYENLNNVLMDYNKISSVSALADCHKLISVNVYGNPVSNVSALTDMDVVVNYTPKT